MSIAARFARLSGVATSISRTLGAWLDFAHGGLVALETALQERIWQRRAQIAERLARLALAAHQDAALAAMEPTRRMVRPDPIPVSRPLSRPLALVPRRAEPQPAPEPDTPKPALPHVGISAIAQEMGLALRPDRVNVRAIAEATMTANRAVACGYPGWRAEAADALVDAALRLPEEFDIALFAKLPATEQPTWIRDMVRRIADEQDGRDNEGGGPDNDTDHGDTDHGTPVPA